ncbi:hypothetical protein EDC94DRAFT_617119 [Helicostylum pulchrum]|nr:hypothetical protein EDC94DRAFT_617119 [Helicostylum pulchrum]
MGDLKLKGQGEDWYRIHPYGSIWDRAFSSDDNYETKRSECSSKITTMLKQTIVAVLFKNVRCKGRFYLRVDFSRTPTSISYYYR